jgi:hypothetical protein
MLVTVRLPLRGADERGDRLPPALAVRVKRHAVSLGAVTPATASADDTTPSAGHRA